MIFGWLGANKVRIMRIKNLTGFMLGNESCNRMVGSVWSDYDCRVWLCPNLAKAEKVLQQSQQERLDPSVMWTTIYQVSAKDIVCEQSGNGLLYTNTPTKIFVNRIVARHAPRDLTQEQLLARARHMQKDMMRLILESDKEDVK